jgi:asparagine synthase (glutamine-hydrolysing)
MCGLAGLIRVDGGPVGAEDARLVRAMCDLIAYRGPDDSGVQSVGAACLGSRRLAIIDLSAAGHMPMSDPSGRWWIAYNGEAYNFADVRAELEQLGVRFRSNTDTEVLLQAWIAWGRQGLERFVGMFAFAIYDRETGELALGRDRFGVKPLYWTRDNNRIAFASEIKSLMLARTTNALDRQTLGQWWLYRNVDALIETTLIEGINKLLPGHLAIIRDGEVRVEAWYSPLEHVDESEYRRLAGFSEQDICDHIERQLEEAVRLRLVSDVPVGTLLSGGLDSSLVTALAANHSDKLSGFHVSVAGQPRYDERRYAQVLADRLRIPFHVVDMHAGNFRASLAHVTWLEDMPLSFANSVGYFLVSQLARQQGTIVVLSGEGADELFGGYDWNYRRRRLLRRLLPLMRLMPESVRRNLELLVYRHAGLPASSHHFRYLLPTAVMVLDRFARADLQERCHQAYAFLGNEMAQEVSASMLSDLSNFLAPLLRRLDRNSMGASIEARVPFLDHRLAHTAINLPLKWRSGRYTDKWILKQIARKHVPHDLIRRRKMGFPLPLRDYIAPLAAVSFFRGGFCEQVLGFSRRGIERMIEHERQRPDGMFSLVGLEIWGRQFLLGQSTDSVAEHIGRAIPA